MCSGSSDHNSLHLLSAGFSEVSQVVLWGNITTGVDLREGEKKSHAGLLYTGNLRERRGSYARERERERDKEETEMLT